MALAFRNSLSLGVGSRALTSLLCTPSTAAAAAASAPFTANEVEKESVVFGKKCVFPKQMKESFSTRGGKRPPGGGRGGGKSKFQDWWLFDLSFGRKQEAYQDCRLAENVKDEMFLRHKKENWSVEKLAEHYRIRQQRVLGKSAFAIDSLSLSLSLRLLSDGKVLTTDFNF